MKLIAIDHVHVYVDDLDSPITAISKQWQGN